MPPKQLNGKGGRTVAEPSFARSTIQGLTSAENRSVVTSIGLFAIGVTFLHSSWAEILLPA
ncbi:hypothetical protein C7974DRAFT_402087 [Boeremia exigua]|uniref:uncharacterized protein n=1 Tax=Boeremia exigua TaxID=749465 RepID=UPI001E8E4405|nr:uncharacterized protein C7974DRAFT_402087 [Boeremia exigua]KAH6616597.1 hypothetical protein C7974DRAFT_402087 [Boeremia exigua]